MVPLMHRIIMLLNSVLIVSIYIQTCKSELNNFYEYLNGYEMAECQIVKHKTKRNLKRGNMNHEKMVEIKLKSATRTFNLLLFEDQFYNDISFNSSLSSENRTDKVTPTKFYEGVLKNKPLQTSVMGYLHNGTFCGAILDGENTYFVQPVKILKPTSTGSSQVVIYKTENLNLPQQPPVNETNSFEALSLMLSIRTSNVTVNSTRIREGISLENRTDDIYCDIEIVADHTLYEYFKGDSNQLSAFMYLHAKHADKIFRNTDFNMDGIPDGVRISVAGIDIYKAVNDPNYPMVEVETLNDYLTKLVEREQERPFCLSISMSYRTFKGTFIGEAFRADSTYPNAAGGICEQSIADENERSMNYNIAAVNLQLGGSLLPLAVTLLAFTHEIGHGFGSDHDDIMYKPCSPEKPNGKYLMHPTAIPASEQRPEFSPCSRKAISKVLTEKGGCLEPRKPSCGNGIKEGNEECDCGWTTICGTIDPCCNPHDVQFPAIGCTLKGNKSECSPKESECCTENCTVKKNPKTLCYNGISNCTTSYCDGVSPVCPVTKDSLVDDSCRIKSLTYDQSICSLKNLEECNCTNNILHECLVCCKRYDNCVPASDVGILNPAGGKYVRKPLTRCNLGVFHCDAAGRCINPNLYKKPAKKKHNVVLIVILTLLAFIVTGVFFIILYYFASTINLRDLFLLRNHF